jgi:acrylyl-CoA reductase (NADPH)
MTSFTALQVDKEGDKQLVRLVELTEADLMPGDVTVKVEHSTVNYKDGLAVTAKGPIIRKFPLIPGIDFAGTVTQSSHGRFRAGDKVVLNGWGVGESHHGGYAGMARVSGDWLVALPPTLSTSQAMAIGTAGYTAMLCIMALEFQGVKPESGDILVTGAAGGVGSVAITVLAKLGYRVIASTGRLSEEPYLKSLGAAGVIDRNEFNTPLKPLAKARFAGAVDSVGSLTLANVLSQINPEGTVAATGLAQGMDLPASMAPFILRGVKLIGVNSVTCPYERRVEAWRRLAADLDRNRLASMTQHIKLGDIPRIAEEIVVGKVRGRVVVDL